MPHPRTSTHTANGKPPYDRGLSTCLWRTPVQWCRWARIPSASVHISVSLGAVLSPQAFKSPATHRSPRLPSSSGGPEPLCTWSWCRKPAPSAARAAMMRGQLSIPRAWGPRLQPPELLEESQNMLHCCTHVPSSEHSVLADNLHPRVTQRNPSCLQISAPFALTSSSQFSPAPPHSTERPQVGTSPLNPVHPIFPLSSLLKLSL